MLAAVLVLVVLAVLAVVLPLLVVLALAGFGIHLIRRPFRERRRRAAVRRQIELAEQARARRFEAKARRRAAIRARTGLDTELLGHTMRDLVRGAGDRVRRVGERITRALEARRAPDADPAPAPTRNGWLDLDTDLGSLQSQARTVEMLRLSDQLRGTLGR